MFRSTLSASRLVGAVFISVRGGRPVLDPAFQVATTERGAAEQGGPDLPGGTTVRASGRRPGRLCLPAGVENLYWAMSGGKSIGRIWRFLMRSGGALGESEIAGRQMGPGPGPQGALRGWPWRTGRTLPQHRRVRAIDGPSSSAIAGAKSRVALGSPLSSGDLLGKLGLIALGGVGEAERIGFSFFLEGEVFVQSERLRVGHGDQFVPEFVTESRFPTSATLSPRLGDPPSLVRFAWGPEVLRRGSGRRPWRLWPGRCG